MGSRRQARCRATDRSTAWMRLCHKVPAIGALGCLGCAFEGAFGIGAGAVAADHLGVVAEPVGKDGGLTVDQKVDGPVGGHVDQDSAMAVAATGGEVVQARRGDLADVGIGKSVNQPDQGGTAGRQAERARRPRTGVIRQSQRALGGDPAGGVK